MSLLETICKELGVEIDEHWKGSDGRTYVIDEVGQLHYYNENSKTGGYINANEIISKLIIGDLKPVWKPNEGDTVYYPNITCMSKDKVDIDTYEPNSREIEWWNYMIDNNLVFRTKEEAIAAANKMLKSIKEEK